MRELIGYCGLIGLVAVSCVIIGIHIWECKDTIKEHEKRIAELEKKLKSVRH